MVCIQGQRRAGVRGFVRAPLFFLLLALGEKGAQLWVDPLALPVGDPVDHEDAVEVVVLMHHNAGAEVFEVLFDGLAVEGLVGDVDAAGALDVDVDAGDREAALFAAGGLFGGTGKAGVEDHFGLAEVVLPLFVEGLFADDEDPVELAHLGGGEANAVVGNHHLDEIFGEGRDLRRDLFDGLRLRPKERMPKAQDLPLHSWTSSIGRGAGGLGEPPLRAVPQKERMRQPTRKAPAR